MESNKSIGEPLAKRMKKMMANENYADIHFFVGKDDEKEKVFAHKSVLVASSDVFEAMFPFDAVNSNVGSVDNPVVIDDIDADVFKVMLRYIYSDDLSQLNGDNLMEVLYAANKYNISLLVKACLDFPIGELPNVFVAYEKACLLDFKDFACRCLLYIDENAETLLKSEEFLGIDQEMLCEILESDQLKTIGEISIWEAAIRWADAQCRHNDKECSAEIRRDVLGSALFEIRVPLISKKGFSTKIVPSGVLTKDELLGVYQYHCHPNLSDSFKLYALRFPTQERFSDRKEGTLTLEIEELSEFAREEFESERISQNAIFIGGLPWKISAQLNKKSDESTEKCLGIYLWCTVPKKDTIWSCKCSATVRIVSQKKGTKDLTEKFNGDEIFNAKSTIWGFPDFITITDLMNVAKGYYNKKEDKVKLAIDVSDVAIIT